MIEIEHVDMVASLNSKIPKQAPRYYYPQFRTPKKYP